MIWPTIGIVSDFVESQWRLKEQAKFALSRPSLDLKGTEKTGNKTVQFVLEHCCKSIVARFNSPGTNQVCVKTDFWLRGSHAIDESYVTCCKTSLSWAGTEQKVGLLKNSFSQPATTRFVGGQVWRWVVKRITSLFNSCRSSVTRRVARFCFPFYPAFN